MMMHDVFAFHIVFNFDVVQCMLYLMLYYIFDVVYVLYRPAEFLRTKLHRIIMMGVLVSTQARSHNYLYINYRGRLEMLQTIGNQRTKVRKRRSYLHSEGQRLYDKHL